MAKPDPQDLLQDEEYQAFVDTMEEMGERPCRSTIGVSVARIERGIEFLVMRAKLKDRKRRKK